MDRAMTLNPSYAFGWRHSGFVNLYAGRTAIAIEHYQAALRLDPRANRANHLMGIGLAHFFDGRFEEALENLRSASEELPSHINTHRYLAACYAHMGRPGEAREIVERLRAIAPCILESGTRFRNPEHRELYLSGLRLALGEAAT
jgi:adenylate cyclase